MMPSIALEIVDSCGTSVVLGLNYLCKNFSNRRLITFFWIAKRLLTWLTKNVSPIHVLGKMMRLRNKHEIGNQARDHQVRTKMRNDRELS